MNDIEYVSDESRDQAQDFEVRLLALSRNSGILFAGVEAVPVVGGKCNTFRVRVGIDRKYNETVGTTLIAKVLENELRAGVRVQATVFRGRAWHE